ncbi:MAG TPA: VOC family protein [Methylovirgula sp.]|nr:VOC family protein [Methylovirgula sp.]
MIDHIGLRTKEFASLVSFYGQILAPLGYSKVVQFEDAIGFGRDGKPSLWVGASDQTSAPLHIAFASPTREAVDRFHQAALAAGARDNGKPGLRPDYHPDYYAAFVIDPMGNNIEAVCHASG